MTHKDGWIVFIDQWGRPEKYTIKISVYLQFFYGRVFSPTTWLWMTGNHQDLVLSLDGAPVFAIEEILNVSDKDTLARTSVPSSLCGLDIHVPRSGHDWSDCGGLGTMHSNKRVDTCHESSWRNLSRNTIGHWGCTRVFSAKLDAPLEQGAKTHTRNYSDKGMGKKVRTNVRMFSRPPLWLSTCAGQRPDQSVAFCVFGSQILLPRAQSLSHERSVCDGENRRERIKCQMWHWCSMKPLNWNFWHNLAQHWESTIFLMFFRFFQCAWHIDIFWPKRLECAPNAIGSDARKCKTKLGYQCSNLCPIVCVSSRAKNWEWRRSKAHRILHGFRVQNIWAHQASQVLDCKETTVHEEAPKCVGFPGGRCCVGPCAQEVPHQRPISLWKEGNCPLYPEEWFWAIALSLQDHQRQLHWWRPYLKTFCFGNDVNTEPSTVQEQVICAAMSQAAEDSSNVMAAVMSCWGSVSSPDEVAGHYGQ